MGEAYTRSAGGRDSVARAERPWGQRGWSVAPI